MGTGQWSGFWGAHKKDGNMIMVFILTALTAIIIILGLFFSWRFYLFFRDPKRTAPMGNNVVSPADGYIVYIKEVKKGEVPISIKNKTQILLREFSGIEGLGGEGILIGIYMNILGVHYNRSSIAGRVKRVVYRPSLQNLSMATKTGVFMHLFLGKRPYDGDGEFLIQNERNTLVINGDVTVAVIQIADKYVRKIDCYIEEGQIVSKGDKIGMIRMGSQVDLFICNNGKLDVSCKVGDRVIAGETILARW